MRILMLNWRYVGHPSAGGAELLTHEVLRRMVARGHRATCFSGAFPEAAESEERDGVLLVRRGGQATVHVLAWRWLRRRLDEFDLVVDQINTIPFMTPLYVPAGRRVFMIHQLAREYWWRETRGLFRLVSPAGYVLEPLYLRLYGRTPGMTVSRSTLDDLTRLGIPRERVTVLPEASDVAPLEKLTAKPEQTRIIVIGRLTPAKFVEEAVRAFAVVAKGRPEARLDVVGGGDPAYRRRLETLVSELGLASRITFHGRVSHERKIELLERSRLHVFASHREGWGLTVTEAGALGTPSVGYDAPGVRDSIASPEQLARLGDSEALGRVALRLLSDPTAYERARAEAWNSARALSYERTADAFESVLHEVSAAPLRARATAER